jgi:hypothetical protein
MSSNISTKGINEESSSGSTPNSPRGINYYSPPKIRTHKRLINGQNFITKTDLVSESDLRTHTWFDENSEPVTIVQEII